MQGRLPASAGLCRHQNVLRASQCSTSGRSATPAAAGASFAPPSLQQRSPIVVVNAVASDSLSPSTQPARQQWSYKYKRQRCPSPCGRDDLRCQELEALVQNVLSYPNLPARIHRVLPALSADLRSMTALVESLASHFGKELTLYYIRKQPRLLNLDFPAVLQACADLRAVAGVRDAELPQLLRKCPSLLLLSREDLTQRFEAIPRIVQFSPAQVRALVVKFPTVLCFTPHYLKSCVDRLRQLCYTREEWARDFDTISPSLMAFFLRDTTDLLMRLEYLASTGERPEWMLREVFKPANRTFRSKLRNYAQWELRVKQQRAQHKAAAAAAQQQAVQQAEAAAIKAAILAAEGQGEGGSSSSSSPQAQQ